MSEFYDRQGRPLTLEEWATKLEDWEYKVVDKTTLPNGLEVSTVWLGLNHRYGVGSPLIFETMVFGGERTIHLIRANQRMRHGDHDCDRYPTEELALLGHRGMCVRWSKSPGPAFMPRGMECRLPRKLKKRQWRNDETAS